MNPDKRRQNVVVLLNFIYDCCRKTGSIESITTILKERGYSTQYSTALQNLKILNKIGMSEYKWISGSPSDIMAEHLILEVNSIYKIAQQKIRDNKKLRNTKIDQTISSNIIPKADYKNKIEQETIDKLIKVSTALDIAGVSLSSLSSEKIKAIISII